MKFKITKLGKRVIQDRLRKSMTKKEQDKLGDLFFSTIADLLATDIEKSDGSILYE